MLQRQWGRGWPLGRRTPTASLGQSSRRIKDRARPPGGSASGRPCRGVAAGRWGWGSPPSPRWLPRFTPSAGSRLQPSAARLARIAMPLRGRRSMAGAGRSAAHRLGPVTPAGSGHTPSAGGLVVHPLPDGPGESGRGAASSRQGAGDQCLHRVLVSRGRAAAPGHPGGLRGAARCAGDVRPCGRALCGLPRPASRGGKGGRKVQCISCGGRFGIPLCAQADRPFVITFPAHGPRAAAEAAHCS